ATPTLSAALADTVTEPETVAPELGAVMDTVGGVESVVPESARKATSCMTHALPFCRAVPAYEPTAVTTRSWVRFPNAVDLVVNPEPPWLTLLFDAPATNKRSLAFVVAA